MINDIQTPKHSRSVAWIEYQHRQNDDDEETEYFFRQKKKKNICTKSFSIHKNRSLILERLTKKYSNLELYSASTILRCSN